MFKEGLKVRRSVFWALYAKNARLTQSLDRIDSEFVERKRHRSC